MDALSGGASGAGSSSGITTPGARRGFISSSERLKDVKLSAIPLNNHPAGKNTITTATATFAPSSAESSVAPPTVTSSSTCLSRACGAPSEGSAEEPVEHQRSLSVRFRDILCPFSGGSETSTTSPTSPSLGAAPATPRHPGPASEASPASHHLPHHQQQHPQMLQIPQASPLALTQRHHQEDTLPVVQYVFDKPRLPDTPKDKVKFQDNQNLGSEKEINLLGKARYDAQNPNQVSQNRQNPSQNRQSKKSKDQQDHNYNHSNPLACRELPCKGPFSPDGYGPPYRPCSEDALRAAANEAEAQAQMHLPVFQPIQDPQPAHLEQQHYHQNPSVAHQQQHHVVAPIRLSKRPMATGQRYTIGGNQVEYADAPPPQLPQKFHQRRHMVAPQQQSAPHPPQFRIANAKDNTSPQEVRSMPRGPPTATISLGGETESSRSPADSDETNWSRMRTRRSI